MTRTLILKKNLIFLLPLLLLSLFIISILDRNFYIGGDLIFPINPSNSLDKSLYLWEQENGGVSFFKYMYLLWQVFFYFFSFLGFPADIVIKIFITFFYIVGFIFTYLSYRLIFQKTKYGNKIFAVSAGIFFLLNPSAILVVIGFYPLYVFPACVFFLLKYLETKKVFYLIPFSFFFNLGYFSYLPQAKCLVIFSLGLIFIVFLYKEMRHLKIKDLILPLCKSVVLFILLNAFLIIPFVRDVFQDRKTAELFQNVSVYDGKADLYSASLPYTMRFYNSNLVNNQSKLGISLQNPIFILWTFFLWILVLLAIWSVKKRVFWILLIPVVVFMFLAKGVNPPFGEVYLSLLSNFPFFKIFRTTSTTVIAGSLFFTILLTLTYSVIYQKNKVLFYLFLFIHILIFHPVYFGYKLFNYPGGGSDKKGITIPEEYIKTGKFLDETVKDSKILSLPLDDGYSYKDWGYIGSSLLNWLTRKPLIHSYLNSDSGVINNKILRSMAADEACVWTSLYNVGFILMEKDARGDDSSFDFKVPKQKIMENDYFSFYKTDEKCLFSRIYIADGIVNYFGEGKNIFLAGISKEDFGRPLIFKVASPPAGVESKTVGEYQEGPNLIEETDWFDERKGDNFSKLAPPSLIAIEKAVMFQEIKNWKPGTTYLLRIKHKTAVGKNLGLLIDEQKKVLEGRKPFWQINTTLLDKKVADAGEEKTEEIVLRSDFDSLGARIYIYNLDGNAQVTVEIKQITSPRIFSVSEEVQMSKTPGMQFKKINPTKYLVDISQATEPYYLVFSETYHQEWKLRILDHIIPKDRHFQVNGYANGWYITPQDSQGQKDYQVVIEYFPQRLFLIGGIISILSGLSIIFLSFLKKKEYV